MYSWKFFHERSHSGSWLGSGSRIDSGSKIGSGGVVGSGFSGDSEGGLES